MALPSRLFQSFRQWLALSFIGSRRLLFPCPQWLLKMPQVQWTVAVQSMGIALLLRPTNSSPEGHQWPRYVEHISWRPVHTCNKSQRNAKKGSCKDVWSCRWEKKVVHVAVVNLLRHQMMRLRTCWRNKPSSYQRLSSSGCQERDHLSVWWCVIICLCDRIAPSQLSSLRLSWPPVLLWISRWLKEAMPL